MQIYTCFRPCYDTKLASKIKIPFIRHTNILLFYQPVLYVFLTDSFLLLKYNLPDKHIDPYSHISLKCLFFISKTFHFDEPINFE